MGHLASRSFSFTRSKKLSVGRSVIGVVSLLVVAGCGVTDCCLIDVSSQVIVQGTTMEADGSPVSGVAVAPLGRLTYQCTTEISSLFAEPPVALSDADGFFQQRVVSVFGAGPYCIDFTATHPDGIRVDTLRNIEARFRLLAETPDTVFLLFEFGG